jgi:hypothetical protein
MFATTTGFDHGAGHLQRHDLTSSKELHTGLM